MKANSSSTGYAVVPAAFGIVAVVFALFARRSRQTRAYGSVTAYHDAGNLGTETAPAGQLVGARIAPPRQDRPPRSNVVLATPVGHTGAGQYKPVPEDMKV